MLLVGAVVGAVVARSLRPVADPAGSADVTATSAPADDRVTVTTEPMVVPTAPPFPAGCTAPTLAGPDVDGDGCPEAVTLTDRVATVGTASVELGQDGDLVTLADPDCDGVVTPILYRPSTGEVFVFPRWSLAEPMQVDATALVPGGRSIAATGGQCGPVTVTDADGAETIVAGPGT